VTIYRTSLSSVHHNIDPNNYAYTDTVVGSAGKTLTITDLHMSSFGFFLVQLSFSNGSGDAPQFAVGPDNQVNLSGMINGPHNTFGGSDGDLRLLLQSPDYGLLQGSYSGYSNLPAFNFYIAGELV